jgi:Myb/SANT-like DNA-binding domain
VYVCQLLIIINLIIPIRINFHILWSNMAGVKKMLKKSSPVSKVKKTVCRAPNFTNLEKDILVDLISKYRNTIENNKTDGVSVQEKNKAWTQLTGEFNSTPNVHKRSTSNLRTAYDNIKKSTKKTVANDKVRTFKTGGGNSPSKVTPCDMKVMALLGPRITPLKNSFDSDAAYNHEEIGNFSNWKSRTLIIIIILMTLISLK